MNLSSVGGIALNTASGQSLALQQNGGNRFEATTAGLVLITPDANQEAQITTANVAGTSGAIQLTTGTGATGGNIVLNTQGTTAGTINLRQNGTNRLSVSTDGALTATPATNQNISLTAAGTGRVVVAGAGVQFPDAGPSTSVMDAYVVRSGTLAFSGPFNSSNAAVRYVKVGRMVFVHVTSDLYAVTGNNTASVINSAAMPYTPQNAEEFREELVTINNNNSFFTRAVLQIRTDATLRIGNNAYDPNATFAAVVSPNVIGFRAFSFSFEANA